VFIQKSSQVGHFGPNGRFRGPFGRVFNGGPDWGLGISRLIVMILFLLIVGAVAYFVIRHFDHAQTHHHGHVNAAGGTSSDSAAANILKMRFAKGEIDEDEFTRRMNTLKDHLSVS
jgi:putative membrane protein